MAESPVTSRQEGSPRAHMHKKMLWPWGTHRVGLSVPTVPSDQGETPELEGVNEPFTRRNSLNGGRDVERWDGQTSRSYLSNLSGRVSKRSERFEDTNRLTKVGKKLSEMDSLSPGEPCIRPAHLGMEATSIHQSWSLMATAAEIRWSTSSL